jgi:hypothetical protein
MLRCITEDGVDDAARRGAQAFQDERIEIVESADHAIGNLATFRRIGIGIAEMREVAGQGRFALHGNGVARLCPCMLGHHMLGSCILRRYRQQRKGGGQPESGAAHDGSLCKA